MPGSNPRTPSTPSGRTVYRGPAGSGTRAQGQRNAPGFASGLGALADMLSGATVGATAATLGVGGDLEQLARGLYGAATARPEQDALAAGLLAADRSTLLPTTQDMRGYLPNPTQFSIPADQNAYAQLGEFLPLPVSPTAVARGAAVAGRDVAGGARSALGALGRVGAAGVEMGAQGRGPLSFMQQALEPSYAVRPRGGNFSDLRLDDYLGGALHVHTPDFLDRVFGVEHAGRTGAAAEWAQKQLANYLKRDLGAPTDPLLQVEKDLPNLHFGADGMAGMPPEGEDVLDMQTWRELNDLAYRRAEMGRGYGRQQRALQALQVHDALTGGQPLTPWGAYSGAALEPLSPAQHAEDLAGWIPEGQSPFEAARDMGLNVDWLEKAPADTKIWSLSDPTEDLLGFNHVLDYFEAAQRAAADVQNYGGAQQLRDQLARGMGGARPEAMAEWQRALAFHDAGLALTPEQIAKTSVADAVRKTAAWNDLLAQGMGGPANPDLMRGWQALKEYPEDGMKWVEFNPGVGEDITELPEGYRVVENTKLRGEGGVPLYTVAGPEGATWGQLSKTPEEAVQGWLPEFNAARRNAELRAGLNAEGDAMGHCVGGYCDSVQSRGTKIYSLRDKNGNPHVTIETRPGRSDVRAWMDEMNPDLLAQHLDEARRQGVSSTAYLNDLYESAGVAPPDEIIQIKGKQNAAPVAKYLPFVQDFVKSRQWGRVGDLQNTGLTHYSGGKTKYRAGWGQPGMYGPPDMELDMPTGYMTAREAAQHLIQQGAPEDWARQHVGDFSSGIDDEGLQELRANPLQDDYAQGGSVQPSAFMQRAQAMLAGR